MKIETLLWGLLPALVAVASWLGSFLIAVRARSLGQWIATTLVFAGVVWSLLCLHKIFVVGAWPTFLPHIVIAVAVFIVATQALLIRRRRQDVA